MPERTVTVTAPSGLHARPVGEMVKMINDAGLPVTIGRPGAAPVDARSILGVISLGVVAGDEVVISSPDAAADALLDALAEHLATTE